MTPENNSNGGEAPVRSAIEIAMSGQRPMDNTSTQTEPTSTPIQSALEKAMSGQRPPITHEANNNSVAPKQGSYESKGSSQNLVDLSKYPEILISAEKDTPTVSPENAAHQEEMRKFRDQTTIGITGENIGGSGEPNRNDGMAEAAIKERLHKEELDRTRSLNEGFAPTRSNPEAAKALGRQDAIIAELKKETTPTEDLHQETVAKELTPEQQELKEIKVLIHEQSVQIQQLILIMQQNITNIHNNTVINGVTEPAVPTEVHTIGDEGPILHPSETEDGTETPEVPLTPEQQEIVDIKIAVTKQSEQINQLIAIMQQTNNININNINGTGPVNPTEVPTAGDDGTIVPPAETTTTTTTTETTPVTPETTPTPEARRKLKIAYIAGAVIGGSTGVLGGVPAAGIGALVCIAGGLLNTGLNKLSSSGVERWNRRLATVTDPTERTKLEKRVKDLEKVKKFTETTAKDFLRGARHGLLASSIFSGVFLAGHGLAWNTPEPIMPTPTNPTGTGGGTGAETGPGTGTGTGGEAGGGTSPETYQGNDFIDKDGVIHAPGSAWDNNQVPEHTGNLPGGADNSNNYINGPWDHAKVEVRDWLKQNNVTDTTYLDNYDRKRIIDETWLAMRNGNTNPDIAQVLEHIGTEGTTRLLSSISKP